MLVAGALALGWSLTGSPAFAEREPLEVEVPDLKLPRAAESKWVARKMAFNNVPMTIKTFTYPGSPRRFKRFLRREWQGEGFGGMVEEQNGPERVIGFGTRAFYYSVHYRPNGQGGMEGKVVVTQAPHQAEPDKSTKFPLMPHTRIRSVIKSLDAGKRAQTITGFSERSVNQNANYMHSQLRQRGYEPAADAASSLIHGPANRWRKGLYSMGDSWVRVDLRAPEDWHKKDITIIVHWTQPKSQ